MSDAISVDTIAVLKYLPKDLIAKLQSHFSSLDVPQEQIVLRTGETVDFLYIVAKGKVDVYADLLCTEYLTTLSKGDTIGEMSLTLDSRSSSATLRAGPGGCKLGLVSFIDFKRTVLDKPENAYGFFRGVAELLSLRLRETNKKAKTSLHLAVTVLQDILNRYQAGNTNPLVGMTPKLNQALELPHLKLHSALLASVRDAIEQAMARSPQDLVHFFEHLDILLQFLENVSRVMSGREIKTITNRLPPQKAV